MTSLNIYTFFTFLILSDIVDGQCAFPSQLLGVWKGADRGDVDFTNSTFMSGYQTMIPSNPKYSFTCLEQRGSTYFLKATQENVIFGVVVKFYMCLEIQSVDADVAYYYQLTAYDPYLQDNILGVSNADGTFDTACVTTPVRRNFITLVRDGSVSDGSMNNTCPEELQVQFGNVSIQHHSAASPTLCPGTVFDVCTDKTLVNITYNATCATTATAKTLSAGGVYRCIHSVIEGSTTYLSMWNDDTGVMNPFSCFAFQRIGDTIFASESPKFCSNSTSYLAAGVNGVKMVIWDIIGTCEIILPTTTAEPVNLAGLWSLLVLPILFIILWFIFLTIYCYRRFGCICKRIKFPKRKKVPPIVDDGTGVPDIVGNVNFTPNVIKPPRLYNFRPKKPLENFFPLFDPEWNPHDVPNLQPAAKVEPLYKDTLDDYLRGRLPRRPSGASLYSFHSGRIANGYVS